MITLQELYNYLVNGTTPSALGAFQEPAAGPTVATMKTLQEIYAAIKALFDQITASAVDVRSGKKYFSTSPWGIQTGTAVVATGNATTAQVLAGRTFSNTSAAGLTGAMPNRGAVTITPGTTAQTITQGYHDGTGSVAGDAELTDGNIADGVEIFGVTGTARVATGNATTAQVLAGAIFSNYSAVGLTGTMPNRGAVTITPGTTAQTIPQGYHNGSGTVAGDEDLAAANIKSGVEIFGVTGTLSGAGVPKTGQTTSYATGDDGDLEKGVAWPAPRFTANTDNNGDGDCTDAGETCDGTVTDNLTGLIWLKNANCASAMRNWTTALSDVAQFNTNGTMNGNNCEDTSNEGSHQTDWRLPNVRELYSLIDISQDNPALLSSHPFTGMQSATYWSSSTYVTSTVYAWTVYLYYGNVAYTRKTTSAFVWPVRGGQ